MRILALTNLFPNPRQPHRAAFNRQQFTALARDHEVQVIAPIAWTQRIKASGAMADFERMRTCAGVTVHHPDYLFTPKVLRGSYGHFYARSVRACFTRVAHEFDPDVVLGSWAYPDGWAAVRLARAFALPVAIKVHGSDILGLHPDGSPGSRYGRTVRGLRSADAVITVGSHLREQVRSMGVDPSRTHIVYSGIDTHTFHPGSRSGARAKLSLPPDKPLIVFAGNLVPVKGLDILAAALARLASLAPPFHCVLIGDGPLRASLNARFDALALGPFVRLLGARPQNELADWYRAADCVVLPSRSEGIPNVLLEAAACGTPTVASSVGGVPEVCDPAGLVPPCDPMALCERLRLFLNNTTRPGTHARFKPGSWQDSASRLAAVLHDILPASPARRAA